MRGTRAAQVAVESRGRRVIVGMAVRNGVVAGWVVLCWVWSFACAGYCDDREDDVYGVEMFVGTKQERRDWRKESVEMGENGLLCSML